jgi:putative effector of murein hydrolase
MRNEFQTQLPPISDIWVYLSGSPLLALVLTLSAYLLGLTLYERSQRNPLANPVLIAVVVVTLSISVLDMPYAKYFEGAQFVHFLLGTATVSLAIPIYKGFASLKGRMGVLLLSLVAGGVTSVFTAVGMARWLVWTSRWYAAWWPNRSLRPLRWALPNACKPRPP